MKEHHFTFMWKASTNPGDCSGVAEFECGEYRTTVTMGSFAEALNLNKLIEKACERSKQRTLDRASDCISRLLKDHRYD